MSSHRHKSGKRRDTVHAKYPHDPGYDSFHRHGHNNTKHFWKHGRSYHKADNVSHKRHLAAKGAIENKRKKLTSVQVNGCASQSRPHLGQEQKKWTDQLVLNPRDYECLKNYLQNMDNHCLQFSQHASAAAVSSPTSSVSRTFPNQGSSIFPQFTRKPTTCGFCIWSVPHTRCFAVTAGSKSSSDAGLGARGDCKSDSYVVISGLPGGTRASEILQLVTQHGKVRNCKIGTSKDSDSLIALVAMATVEEAKQCILGMSGQDFKGTKMMVQTHGCWTRRKELVKKGEKVVWILGNSFIYWAEKKALYMSNDTHPKDVKIIWKGLNGGRLKDIYHAFQLMLLSEPYPDLVLLHTGLHDLIEAERVADVDYCLSVIISLVNGHLPLAQIVWSEIMPMIKYYSADVHINFARVEKKRLFLNRLMQRRMVRSANKTLVHVNIQKKDPALYTTDGKHLSVDGNSVFLRNIFAAIDYFLANPQGLVYPDSVQISPKVLPPQCGNVAGAARVADTGTKKYCAGSTAEQEVTEEDDDDGDNGDNGCGDKHGESSLVTY